MTPREEMPAAIRTERLTLRAPRVSDVGAMIQHANNPKMLETTATLPYPFAESDGLAFVADAIGNASLRAYAIADADDAFIGSILLKFAQGKPPEIGYWLGEVHWGQGYAGEAITALVTAAGQLPGFAYIHARVLAGNPASIRALEKAGFVVIQHGYGQLERHRGKPLLVMQWSAP